MIILGYYSDKLIGTELLGEHREQMTIFCGVPREATKPVFEATDADPRFGTFIGEVYNRSYDSDAYESERRELIVAYTDVLVDAMGASTVDEAIKDVAVMLADDALAYYVARAKGCAYAPMNGASVNLGPRGRLFDDSREHREAIRSGARCFAEFTLFQFLTDDSPRPSQRVPRLKRGHGFEIRDNFKHHGLMIENLHVSGDPDIVDTEVQLVESSLFIRVPSAERVSKSFSYRRVNGPHVYN